MQKAVTPQQSQATWSHGYERMGGFVVRADSVEWATTAADLVVAHGLAYPGSPFGPSPQFVDVLRFPSTEQLRFENATGGTDPTTRAVTGGPFVDRPPFTGNGFVAAPGHVVPLYWVVHSRVPAMSEIVRVGADGSSTLLATYVDVGYGWVLEGPHARSVAFPMLPMHVGPVARWQGATYPADVFDDHVVIAAAQKPDRRLRFSQTASGRFRREVPRDEVDELFEFYLEARWNGLPMRVVDQMPDGRGGTVMRVSYLGHDADLAEGLRMQKMEAAVYEAQLPPSALTDVVASQLIPRAWAVAAPAGEA
ncbi:hypothetical protein Cch01nite_13040 [Cellulomonas chitinilytica]|uniref:Acetoacetate decarboxylase n=1 Tax=Cellulomonas chitinilytica TaxID=398759 RepID=A0A919P1L7_9CELL|nr:hypothetical protein [Cellulomonas chitinilytica]GIG20580.1 hypothetical protein Cch01nite_13040 [Cellulomonas chitinilytica]